MANVLTGLWPTLYSAFNVVSREPIGFIHAVMKESLAEQATINQNIRAAVVPEMAAKDISAGSTWNTPTDQTVNYVDLKITKQRMVDFYLTAEEEKGLMTGAGLPDITTQRFAQAFRTLGNEMELDLAREYRNASRAYGTQGTTPFDTKDDLTDATETMRILDDNGAPKMGRTLVLNTASVAKLLGKQPGMFKVNEAGEEVARRFGQLNPLFGFEFQVSGQLLTHDSGGALTGVAVDNASGHDKGDTDITVDGGGAGETRNHGDIVEFAGDASKYLTNAMAASATTLTLNAPGLREDAANDTLITGTATDYTPNVAMTRDAMILACRVPAVPEGGDIGQRMYARDPHTGIIFEIARFPQRRQVSYEVGVCWGTLAVKPEHMAVLLG